MGLFSKKTKEVVEESGCSCCSGCGDEVAVEKTGSIQSVKILGGGCAKCNQLEANVKEAMEELGIDCEVEHVKDYAEIATMGVMSLPALALNNKVVSSGKVLKKSEVIALIEQ